LSRLTDSVKKSIVPHGRPRLDIQDTEFLLRHLMEAQYAGREIEQAAITLKKVKEIHQMLMDLSIEV